MAARKKLDINQLGAFIVGEATGSPVGAPTKKNPQAVAAGRKGGLKGGSARAKAVPAPQRKATAKKAAKARWSTSN